MISSSGYLFRVLVFVHENGISVHETELRVRCLFADVHETIILSFVSLSKCCI